MVSIFPSRLFLKPSRQRYLSKLSNFEDRD